MHALTIVALLAACACALPNTSTGTNSIKQVAKFDNDPHSIPFVSGSAVGIYDNVLWQGFVLVATNTAIPRVGVVPDSEPNMIAFVPVLADTVEDGTPSMTILYSDSSASAFDLNSLYIGCGVTTLENAAQVISSCILTLKGYNATGSLVAQQDFPFDYRGPQCTDATRKPRLIFPQSPACGLLRCSDWFVTGTR